MMSSTGCWLSEQTDLLVLKALEGHPDGLLRGGRPVVVAVTEASLDFFAGANCLSFLAPCNRSLETWWACVAK